jgi:hypothetical protein
MAGEPPRATSRDRAPRVREWPIAASLLVVAAGLGVAYAHHFRIGTVLAAFGVLLVPARDAGLLVVRGRAFDVAVLLSLAIPMMVLAVVVPPLRP